MNRERLKSLLVRDKVFLRELYQGLDFQKKKKVLNAADDTKLNTLIWFLHYLSTGEIRIKKTHFERIPEKKVSLLRTKVESRRNLNVLMNSDRKTKLIFLNKLAENFVHLLYPLFNEM
jgi:hypothetical protein